MATKTRKFKTQVQQLLDLVIHSLYSKKEIFLRELISNASDAIDRARFESLTNKDITADGEDWKIRIIPDKDAKTLTVRDNGIGMTLEELETNIGTIANSGTRNFLEALQQHKDAATPEFIGQFGVGFYASFMVADRVEVVTRRAGSDAPATRWKSAGEGSYTMEEAEKEGRGTDIILHLNADQLDYLEEWRIRQIVRSYSDYIAYPVVMDVTRTQPAKEEGEEATETVEETTLNSMKAIWKRAKDDVSQEEYHEFYKHISHDYTDPLRVIHYAAEGSTEFRALLYLPSQAAWNLFLRDEAKGIHLYVKNVLITDECREVLPDYLRFVRGVVDSSDLPLNVSREMLQDDAVVRRISKSVVGRILKELADLKEKDHDDYLKFYQEFGTVLKEGIYMDMPNGDKINELLLFQSTQSEPNRPISLRDYVDRMKEGQNEIYFVTGDSIDTARQSPLLEVFRGKEIEVLFFTDPIDEWVVQRLSEYDGMPLKAIDRGDIELGDEKEKKEREEQREKASAEFKDLLELIQQKLADSVKEVRLSNRLTDSACCLVSDEAEMGAHMERIMKAMNQDVPESKRILELNPRHPVLPKMKSLFDQDRDSQRLADYIELLHDQALLTEGSRIQDPLRFTQRISELMVAAP